MTLLEQEILFHVLDQPVHSSRWSYTARTALGDFQTPPAALVVLFGSVEPDKPQSLVFQRGLERREERRLAGLDDKTGLYRVGQEIGVSVFEVLVRQHRSRGVLPRKEITPAAGERMGSR